MGKNLTKEEFICSDCGHIGRAVVVLRGSDVVERFLWYALLLPGPLYSYWRRIDKERECTQCKRRHVVPIDSALGAMMLENHLKKK